MNREETLSAVSMSWQELKSAIAQVPEDSLDERSVGGPWSVKDLIGHVATWEMEALQALRCYLDDDDFDALTAWPEDLDGFNARQVESKRETCLDQLRLELDDTHSRTFELISGLSEADFERSEVSERIRIDTYYHYEDHAGQIRRWLEGAG